MPKKKLIERFPFHLLSGMIHFAVEVLILVKTNVKRSIRIQLMLTFAVCSAAALIAYAAATNMFGEVTKTTYLDYSGRSGRIENEADSMVQNLQEQLARFILRSNGETPAQPDRSSSGGSKASASAPPSGAELSTESSSEAAPSQQSGAASDQSVAASAAVKPVTPAADADASAAAINPKFEANIRQVMNDFGADYKMMLVDMNGTVQYKNQRVSETKVDLFALLNNLDSSRSRQGDVTAIRPVELGSRKLLLVASGYEEPNIITRKGQSPLSLFAAILTFVVLFYWMTRKKMRSIEELAAGLVEISRGRLDYRVAEISQDELGSLASHINLMAGELQRTIEEERRAERTKSELITNVSHDLRTPLTLIMGYLRLLKDRNYENEEQAAQYLNISYGKAEKLKKLIEDLFDYTKLSNHGVPLRMETVCLNELLDQLSEELVTTAENERLYLSRQLPQDRLFVHMDPDKMIRVFENLLMNAIKYSLKPGEVRVRMTRDGRGALVCIANRGEPLSVEQLERLFDRFYRVDSSRSSETGGSGLGLAIAKSIVEAHDGRIWAESEHGEIRFWVELPLAVSLQ